MCAQSVGRTATPLGSFYRRIRGRAGGKIAITATAHKLARIVYGVLRYGWAYVKRSEEEFVDEHRRHQEANFRRRARELGYEVRKIEGPSEDAAVGA